MTIRKLPNRRDMGFSDLTAADFELWIVVRRGHERREDHVVIKVPKSMRFVRDLEKWQKEVELAQIFGAENIGPRVLLANTHPRRIPFMVIQKFGVDLLDEVNNVLEKNYDAKRLEEEGHRIRNAIDGLIDNIARYRDKGAVMPCALGTFDSRTLSFRIRSLTNRFRLLLRSSRQSGHTHAHAARTELHTGRIQCNGTGKLISTRRSNLWQHSV